MFRLVTNKNNISSMIQYQHWEDSTRILITDEQHHGSIQVFIPKLVQWEVMQNPIRVSYLSQFTADTMLILATWEREVEQ